MNLGVMVLKGILWTINNEYFVFVESMVKDVESVHQSPPPAMTVTEPQSKTPDMEMMQLQLEVPLSMHEHTEAVETDVSKEVSE